MAGNPAGTSPTRGSTPPRREFRILALSGGGFLGLYTAAVLAGLEARAGAPLGRRFDLVAGTSVGGILAAALALEVPMSAVVELFGRHGAEVFSNRARPRFALTRLVDMGRSVLGPKYTGAALRKALAEHFGERCFADALHPVLLPAVNVTAGRTKVFKTAHVPASAGDEGVRLLDATMATCAAPAYFPAVRIGGELYADGGLFAVAPDQVALHEAEHFMGVDPARVRMLSVGTATMGYRPAGGVDADAGAVGWLAEGRLILTLVAVQQQHVQAMLEDRLGARYSRLDAAWPEEAGLGVDVATPGAARALLDLAAATLRDLDAAGVAPFV